MARAIPATNEITSFFHCARCLPYKPAAISPRDWANLEAGFTSFGIQVWCRRCDVNIMHVDFQGQRHPANLTTTPPVSSSSGGSPDENAP